MGPSGASAIGPTSHGSRVGTLGRSVRYRAGTSPCHQSSPGVGAASSGVCGPTATLPEPTDPGARRAIAEGAGPWHGSRAVAQKASVSTGGRMGSPGRRSDPGVPTGAGSVGGHALTAMTLTIHQIWRIAVRKEPVVRALGKSENAQEWIGRTVRRTRWRRGWRTIIHTRMCCSVEIGLSVRSIRRQPS